MKIPRSLLQYSRWPLLLVGSAVLLFVVGTATVRESYRGWKVDREIRALEAQADELEGRNARLRELADALRSSERLEVEARARLGLRQPGEHVVVLTGFGTTGSWQGSLALDVVAEKPVVDRPNSALWWEYFFHPERLKD
ncbi:MAG TPA: septum formation initiator family protein [Candidatus Methylomirabilis sp.]|nr:septum formation initiator family protein [Candidatus Methylomirabilis sp.]